MPSRWEEMAKVLMTDTNNSFDDFMIFQVMLLFIAPFTTW